MSFITNKNTTKCSSQSTNHKNKNNPKHKLQINHHPIIPQKNAPPYSRRGSLCIWVIVYPLVNRSPVSCTLAERFALACSLFPALLFVGFGIGLLFLLCFITLAAIVFGWLGCLYCFAILGAYWASYWVFCIGVSCLLDCWMKGERGGILV